MKQLISQRSRVEVHLPKVSIICLIVYDYLENINEERQDYIFMINIKKSKNRENNKYENNYGNFSTCRDLFIFNLIKHNTVEPLILRHFRNLPLNL